ncbi:MAG: hypothetical protein JAY90_18550 [Candidatus Thiodiazotropha lotti]|nr:hypothetical protein [Candidatus Thiodiazotropha lotti]
MAQGVTIDFNANLVKYEKSLDKATADLSKFSNHAQKQASGISKSFKGIGVALAGVVSAGALISLAKESLDFADALAKASEKTGFSITKLQELRFAADQTGVGYRELESALARYTKRLGLARKGEGAANKAYEELGINLKKTNEQVFKEVINTIAEMEDQTDRLALTTRFFGDDAQKLELTIRGGSEQLDIFAKKAHDLGLIMDKELAQGAEAANDQLSIASQVIKIHFTQSFLELAPAITWAAETFTTFIQNVKAGFEVLDSYINPQGQNKFNLLFNRSVELTEQIATQTDYIKNFKGLKFAKTDLEENLWRLKTQLADIKSEMKEMHDQNIDEIIFEGMPKLQTTPTAGGAGVPNILAGTKNGADMASDSVAELRDELDDLLDIYIQEEQQNAKLWAQHEAGTNRAYEATKKLKESTDQLDEEWKDLGLTFRSAFEDAIIEGENLSDVLRSLAQDVLRIFVRKQVTEPLGTILSSIFTSFFKAEGGSVSAGQSYIVGERGPELFTPGVSGHITPNNALGGIVNQVFNIDARGSEPGVEQRIREAVTQAAQEGYRMVIDDFRRNGPARAAL